VGLGFQGSPRRFCLDFSLSNYFCFQKLVFDPTGEVGFACFTLKKSLIYIILMTCSMNSCLSFDGLRHWSINSVFFFLFYKERYEDLIREGETDVLGKRRLGSGYGNNGGCAKESGVHGVFS
jgi:hypothetical protein